MAVERIIPELDRKGLRQFGLVTGALVAGLFGVLLPWLLEFSWPLWPWVIFMVLAALGLATPLALKPVYRTWMRFGILASRVTTPLILGIVFFLVLSPMAIVKKAFGRDAMARQRDDSKSTYRIPSKAKPAKHLEKPF